MKESKNIWNYVFHWNNFTKRWYAVHRDEYLRYWSDPKDRFLSDEDLNELIKKIE